jgi:predicted DNA-binding protein
MRELYCIFNVSTIVKQTETTTFRLTPEEKEVLVKYCELTSRTQSDVFREFLRTLQKRLSKKGVLNPPL